MFSEPIEQINTACISKEKRKTYIELQFTLSGLPIHFTSPPSFSYVAANVPGKQIQEKDLSHESRNGERQDAGWKFVMQFNDN